MPPAQDGIIRPLRFVVHVKIAHVEIAAVFMGPPGGIAEQQDTRRIWVEGPIIGGDEKLQDFRPHQIETGGDRLSVHLDVRHERGRVQIGTARRGDAKIPQLVRHQISGPEPPRFGPISFVRKQPCQDSFRIVSPPAPTKRDIILLREELSHPVVMMLAHGTMPGRDEIVPARQAGEMNRVAWQTVAPRGSTNAPWCVTNNPWLGHGLNQPLQFRSIIDPGKLEQIGADLGKGMNGRPQNAIRG
jgi:hypothetical protein